MTEVPWARLGSSWDSFFLFLGWFRVVLVGLVWVFGWVLHLLLSWVVGVLGVLGGVGCWVRGCGFGGVLVC